MPVVEENRADRAGSRVIAYDENGAVFMGGLGFWLEAFCPLYCLGLVESSLDERQGVVAGKEELGHLSGLGKKVLVYRAEAA